MNSPNSPKRMRLIAGWLVLASALAADPALSQSESFYKGKTLRFVVGSAPANFYDSWARLIARYWGKYIPGNPNVIVHNMPGAGSISATNYVYGVAKAGRPAVCSCRTTAFTSNSSSAVRKRISISGNFTGSVRRRRIRSCFTCAPIPDLKSVGDIVKAKQPPSCGGSGTTSSDYIIARILELTVGAKINSVSGYQGGSDADLAVEKGEIACRAHTLASHFGREPFNSWHKKGFDFHVLQSGRKRDPRAAEAPTIYEILDEFKVASTKRRVAQALLSGGEFGRPVLVTPGTPLDRVKMLRESFRNVLKDAELLAEAKRARMDVEYIAGEELETLVKEVLNQPAEVVEQAKKILGG